MSAALVTSQEQHSLAPAILARREMLNLDRALTYLAGRLRARTPLGAAEYLLGLASFSREAYDERIKIAVAVCSLYRDLFARQYADSQSPLFSLQREQEFYLLCDRHMFPLGDVEAEIAQSPSFFLPCIPLRGSQEHTWAPGCFDLAKIETVYKVAQVLSTRAGSDGWQRLARMCDLDSEAVPRPPLGAVGWRLFEYGCGIEDSPLRYLPAAFHLTNYSTGNVYLDLPPGAQMGFEWSRQKVGELFMARRAAGQIMACVLACDEWLDTAPRERITRVVELWNRASEIEAQEGFAGVVAGEGQFMYLPEIMAMYPQMEGR